jgi:predicted methyltransferase
MSNIYEMLRCADRELKMRKRVYPRLVERERMTVVEADHEIRTMEQIVEHLQKLVDAAEPTLFNNGSKLP